MADETPTPTPKPTAAQPRASRRHDGYYEKPWGKPPHQVTVYQCESCPFDHVNEEIVRQHVASRGHADS
jgi:hypothetical protein